jgi:hypothetical protein
MRQRVRKGILLIALSFMAAGAHAQEPQALKVEIAAARPEIRNGETFTIIDTIVRNDGTEDLLWPHAQCSSFPSGQWAADNASIHVIIHECPYPAKKNPIVYTKLKPGEAVKWKLSIRVDTTPEDLQHGKTDFRLGFLPPRLVLDGMAPQTEKDRIWSNPLTAGVR